MADGRVLILGGAGMLGHRLLLALRSEWDVWATVRRPLREDPVLRHLRSRQDHRRG